MGLFGDLISGAKNKAMREASPVLEVIESEHFSMYDKCDVVVRTMEKSSIAANAKLITKIGQEIQMCNDEEDLWHAFQATYSRRNSTKFAMGISQLLGKRLDYLGSCKVVRKEIEGGKVLYRPR